MTTTVKILIEGNKACKVSVDGQSVSTVQPGTFVTKLISGDQVLSVQETGDFVS